MSSVSIVTAFSSDYSVINKMGVILPNVLYTNDTGRPIFLSAGVSGCAGGYTLVIIEIDGVVIPYNQQNASSWCYHSEACGIVPPNSTYLVRNTNSVNPITRIVAIEV